MGALEINGQTLATESGGTLTSPQLNITQGTLGTAAANVTIVRGELQTDVNINAPLASATLASTTNINAPLASGTTTFPSGTIINRTQYNSSTNQDFTGTTETVYTSIGNPMVFTKKKDSSTSKLFFNVHMRYFNSVGYHIAITFRLRQGTSSSGTEIGKSDVYDLFNSNNSPYRTGRQVSLFNSEVTNLGVGNHNFVLTGARWGYDSPQAITHAYVQIFEIMI